MSYKMDEIINAGLKLKGMKEEGTEHINIVETYNEHEPLARGYPVKMSDPWCMVFISYLFIEAGAVPAIGITECGCEEYLTYARNAGMCVTEPVRGDLVFYDWTGAGRAQHVGIVVSVDQYGYLDVLEGNKSNTVGVRVLNYHCPFIRAIVRPNYAGIQAGKPTVFDPSKVSYAASYDKKIAGVYTVQVDDFLALRFNPFVSEDNLITQILPGERVRCYGYYTNDWYLVTYGSFKGFVNKMHLRR